MRIPSTSDLVQAHSNRAYDKMEVISDHIHEIMELYDWIFNLREYLATKLAMYVSLANDEFISGQKSFLKTLRAPTLRLASIVESLSDESQFTIGTYNGDPALMITFAQEIDDDTVVGTLALAIKRATETPYFAIPATVATESTSAVRLDYLNQVLSTLNSGSDALTGRVTAIENQLANVLPLDTSPTEGSHKGVTSNGIWVAIQNAINGIHFPETVFPVASAEQKGIMQVGEYLTVNNGLVGVDADALATYIRSQLNLDSSISGSLLTYTSVELEVNTGVNFYVTEHPHYFPSDGSEDGLPVDGSDTTKAYLGTNSGNGNAYLTPKPDITANSIIGTTNVKCTNLSTGSSNYYVPLRTVIILTRIDIGLPSNQGGFHKLNTWTVKCWFRNRDYTPTAADITEINDQANAFLATRVPTGTYPDPNVDGVSVYASGSVGATYTSGGTWTYSTDIYYDTGALS